MCALRSCSWPVATFAQTTAWAGKTILFVDECFVLEGQGVISAADVMQYDREGHLVWSSEGMRAWAGAKAKADAPPPAGPAPGEAPQRMACVSLSLRRVLVAVVVVVAVLLAVAAYSNRQEGASSSASPRLAAGSSAAPAAVTSAAASAWPSQFEGIWVCTANDSQEIMFRRWEDVATIRMAPDSSVWSVLTFHDDMLVVTWGDQNERAVYQCVAPSPGTYIGSYRLAVSPGQAPADATCTVSYAGAALTLTFEQQGTAPGWVTFKLISTDGQTMTVSSGGDTLGTGVYRRQ
jgi:hypothetical protein